MRPELRLKCLLPVICIFVWTFTPVCSRRCGGRWKVYASRCYLFMAEYSSWQSAFNTCRALRGQLVEINSAIENDYVRELISEYRVTWTWIGISDSAQEGRWVLATSGEPLKYQNWENREPNNNGDEDCGTIYTNGVWNDVSCNHNNRATFVCEREVSTTPVLSKPLGKRIPVVLSYGYDDDTGITVIRVSP